MSRRIRGPQRYEEVHLVGLVRRGRSPPFRFVRALEERESNNAARSWQSPLGEVAPSFSSRRYSCCGPPARRKGRQKVNIAPVSHPAPGSRCLRWAAGQPADIGADEPWQGAGLVAAPDDDPGVVELLDHKLSGGAVGPLAAAVRAAEGPDATFLPLARFAFPRPVGNPQLLRRSTRTRQRHHPTTSSIKMIVAATEPAAANRFLSPGSGLPRSQGPPSCQPPARLGPPAMERSSKMRSDRDLHETKCSRPWPTSPPSPWPGSC
jgi:hypothetical protein